jgi:Dolichyl-phosphate-mannose-protein mannosyltransferase
MRLDSSGLRSPRVLFLSILLIAFIARMGYGVARYHRSFSSTGAEFITLWDFDALEHVLISKSLIEDGAYRVGGGPGLEGKTVRGVGGDAIFKAPLYQFFLAAVFGISGFNFLLFFPLQALLGGVASGTVAMIALETFQEWRVAAFAGVAAAIHPILVSTASQPYNENPFFALLFASVWAFARWLNTPRLHYAAASGLLAGLAILCRETAFPLLLTMAVFAVYARPAGARQSAAAAGAMVVIAGLVVLPWLVRNLARHRAIVPVSSISGYALGTGNNDCVAAEPIFSWYWAEDPCPSLNVLKDRLMMQFPADQRSDPVINDRVDGDLGIKYITGHPIEYATLSARRAWTVLLPFHPKQRIGTVQRAALALYWLIVVPAGFVGALLYLRQSRGWPMLLALLVAATLLPLVLVYFSPDMRYKIGADLLLACFAGYLYTRIDRRYAPAARAAVALP